MGSELAKREEAALVPSSQRAMILKGSLQDAAEQRALLVRYVKEQMTEGQDYGTIPGAPKPCLFKPGAEKLTELYRSTVDFIFEKEVEDFEKGFFYYRVRAKVVSRDTDTVLGVGIGSCNSRETKYRWRQADRKCPACGQAAIIKGKAEFGGGWVCFKKKNGCGAKYDDMEEAITSQPQGRVENQDVADLVNTILKMATKRAHVAASLQLAGCSDLFTQDLEDLPEFQQSHEPPRQAAPPEKTTPPPSPAPAVPPAAQPPKPNVDPATAAFQQANKSTCAEHGHEWDLKTRVCMGCGASETNTKPASPPPAGRSAQPKEVRAKANRIWMKQNGKGVSLEDFRAWCKSILGKDTPSSEWTQEDVDRLEVASQEPPAREPGAEG